MTASTPGVERFTALPGELTVERLDNGLTVCLLDNPQAPLVSTVIGYRAGSRDEPADQHGVAHFLEHMMFKGSRSFAAGEIDRLTLGAGGSNNAYTTHDATFYDFSLPAASWRQALAIEADRMRALVLDPREVEAERRVILEELATAVDDPWHALDRAVDERLFGEHPYARMVLGDRAGLEAIGVQELAEFHRRLYVPNNAVLVVTGALEPRALEMVGEAFADLERGTQDLERQPAAQSPLSALEEVEVTAGGVAKLVVAIGSVAGDDRQFPAICLLSVLLDGGRSSRLQRRLVEEHRLASWVDVAVDESEDPGSFEVCVELLPGVDPRRVRGVLDEELERVASEPPEANEVIRAQRFVRVNWAFSHQTIAAQAESLAHAATCFGVEHLDRYLAAVDALRSDDVASAAERLTTGSRVDVFGLASPGQPREEVGG